MDNPARQDSPAGPGRVGRESLMSDEFIMLYRRHQWALHAQRPVVRQSCRHERGIARRGLRLRLPVLLHASAHTPSASRAMTAEALAATGLPVMLTVAGAGRPPP
jgi:hypothetical protein